MSDEINLVDATAQLIEAHFAGGDALRLTLDAKIADGWLEFPEALDMIRKDYAANPAPRKYGTLFFVLNAPKTLVGWGGYKGAPVDGAVEIGYAIAAGYRGRGLASLAARAMIERAFDDSEISAVTAHTLAEESASTAILKKLGFKKTGEFTDPEDGPVWAWRLDRR